MSQFVDTHFGRTGIKRKHSLNCVIGDLLIDDVDKNKNANDVAMHVGQMVLNFKKVT